MYIWCIIQPKHTNMAKHSYINNEMIYQKAGFDENSITDYIKTYLNPHICFNFGWGSLNQELIKNVIPLPPFDPKIVGVYNSPKGQSEVIDLVIDFVNKKSGQKITREQIMLTNGATNAIFLLAHYFASVKKLDKVILQNPVFDTALNIFNSQRLNKISVNPDCSDIPDVKNAFAYLIFKFQNPTGISIDKNNKLKIINQITKNGNYVIEDDSYGLLEKGGKLHLISNPLYIFVSSFSKYIFPGLRLGYIIANPEIINDLQVIQKYYNSHPNVMSQYILAQYLNGSLIESEIKHKTEQIKTKRELFEKYLSQKIKSNMETTSGGFYYWLRLLPQYSSVEVFVDLLKQGIITIPGDIYFSKNPYPSLRLSISLIDKEKIKEGCELINKALEKYV